MSNLEIEPIEDVRARLRMLDEPLRIWGAEEPDDDSDDDSDDTDDNDDDDDDSDDDDSDDDSDDDGDDDDDDDSDDKDKSKSKSKGKSKDKEPTLQEKYEASERARIKAERELDKQKKAKAQAAADKDIKKDRDALKTKLEARDQYLTDNLLQIEIAKQKKYNFADVEDVVLLLKSSKYKDDVTIDLDDDTPSVDGLELALKRIAKEKPHLLKKDKDDDDDDDDDEDEQPRRRRNQASGSKAGTKRSRSQQAEDKRLAEKYKIPGSVSAVQRSRVM